MDSSPRQRYRARRRAVTDYRRRIALIAGGFLIFAVLLGLTLRSFRVQQMAVSDALRPTVARTHQPSSAVPPKGTRVPTATSSSDVATAIPVSPTAAPAPFFDDQRFMYEPGFYAPQIQAFLDAQPGPLKRLSFPVGDQQHRFAEVLVGQSCYYSVNPKVLLALLEFQGGLLSSTAPTSEQFAWAMGFHGDNGNWRGTTAQVRWAVRQIFQAKRDFLQQMPLTFSDGSSMPPPSGMRLSEYAVARVLAPTMGPGALPGALRAFLETYMRLFDDPRVPPSDWPTPANPFLTRPMERNARVTSFFDHDVPLLNKSGSVLTYWGREETDIAFAYDGHDGWDYALAPPDMALAAAEGDVVFAGRADDNCATRAVIVDHRNGYRTLYWHLARVDVTIGDRVSRRQPVGVVGESGCARGPHLHFGVQFLGRNVDPYGWCGAVPDAWQQNPAGEVSTWLWVDRPSPCGAPPSDAVVVDTDSSGFARSGDGWQTVPVGYGGSALFVASDRGAEEGKPWDIRPLTTPAVAVWRPALPAAGRYRVLAYLPYALSGLDDATDVRYRIHYAGGEAEVVVDDQLGANDWVDLGTYVFSPDDLPFVSLSNIVGDEQRSVWADALIWLPVTDG